jgi:hypothetical protein
MQATEQDHQTLDQPSPVLSASDERYSCGAVLIHTAWAGWYYETGSDTEEPNEPKPPNGLHKTSGRAAHR